MFSWEIIKIWQKGINYCHISGWNILFKHKNSEVTKGKLLNVIPKHNILYIKHGNKAKRQARKKAVATTVRWEWYC